MLQAKQKLIQGNKRFINNEILTAKLLLNNQQQQKLKTQKPFAVVLGCSDSRIPIETIFDQGPGNLFIIRIAGNIVATSQVGSIELAVSLYNIPLVLVLGHSYCNAVMATIDKLQTKKTVSYGIHSITKRITPSVKTLINKKLPENELINQSIMANIKNSVNKLYKKSEILQQKVDSNQLLITGAHYDLTTRVVDFI